MFKIYHFCRVSIGRLHEASSRGIETLILFHDENILKKDQHDDYLICCGTLYYIFRVFVVRIKVSLTTMKTKIPFLRRLLTEISWYLHLN
jgi:hypothetical protein